MRSFRALSYMTTGTLTDLTTDLAVSNNNNAERISNNNLQKDAILQGVFCVHTFIFFMCYASTLCMPYDICNCLTLLYDHAAPHILIPNVNCLNLIKLIKAKNQNVDHNH